MARPRTLPENDSELTRLILRHGMAEVGRMYGVTTQAVSKAVRDRRLPIKPRADYGDFIPWKLAEQHRAAYEVKMLRLYGKAVLGHAMTEQERRRLAKFRAELAAAGEVITYDRVTGFGRTPATPGDENYVRQPRPAAA